MPNGYKYAAKGIPYADKVRHMRRKFQRRTGPRRSWMWFLRENPAFTKTFWNYTYVQWKYHGRKNYIR